MLFKHLKYLWLGIFTRMLIHFELFMGWIDIIVEDDLMIARDDDFMFKIEFFDNGDKILEMIISSVSGKISSMNENISSLFIINKFEHLLIITMSIRSGYDFDFPFLFDEIIEHKNKKSYKRI